MMNGGRLKGMLTDKVKDLTSMDVNRTQSYEFCFGCSSIFLRDRYRTHFATKKDCLVKHQEALKAMKERYFVLSGTKEPESVKADNGDAERYKRMYDKQKAAADGMSDRMAALEELLEKLCEVGKLTEHEKQICDEWISDKMNDLDKDIPLVLSAVGETEESDE